MAVSLAGEVERLVMSEEYYVKVFLVGDVGFWIRVYASSFQNAIRV